MGVWLFRVLPSDWSAGLQQPMPSRFFAARGGSWVLGMILPLDTREIWGLMAAKHVGRVSQTLKIRIAFHGSLNFAQLRRCGISRRCQAFVPQPPPQRETCFWDVFPFSAGRGGNSWSAGEPAPAAEEEASGKWVQS